MAPTKLERIEQLTRALVAREAEFKANEEVVKRAQFRSHSLRAAVADLRKTIGDLIGDDASAEAPQLPASVAAHIPSGALPNPTRAEGTTLQRVSEYLETESRVFEAGEIAQELGLRVDVVRTTLSKLHARGLIARPPESRRGGTAPCGMPTSFR